MKVRLQYRGGRQQDRMIEDKLRSLKKALIYSYQGATAKFEDGREFRCLMNPSKVIIDEDIKVISMPYKELQLNKEIWQYERHEKADEETGISPGDVIEWVETGTHWLIYNQHLEERAYFRGDARRCDYQIEIGDKKYWIYFKGPKEKLIDWQKNSNNYINTMNYTALMYITNDDTTKEYFSRFKIIKIDGEPWEVQSVDKLTTKGIITITLKEWYKNSIEEAAAAENSEPEEESDVEPIDAPAISGETTVYPYQKYSYSIVGLESGTWSIDNPKKVKIVSQTATTVELEVLTGRSGSAVLTFTNDNEIVSLELTIASL